MREPAPFPPIPATCVLPSAGVRSPAMTFSIVDLPQPEGPTMETNSPSFTVRLTRSRARVAPNAMLSPETETLGGTDPLLVPQVRELCRHHLVVRNVGLHGADLLLDLISEAPRLFSDGGPVPYRNNGRRGP